MVARIDGRNGASAGSPVKPTKKRLAGDHDRLERRWRAAKAAAGQVQDDAMRLLRLRRQRVGDRVRRALWSAAAVVTMALLAVVVACTATIMVLVGAATALSSWLGGGLATGLLIVGCSTLLMLALAVVHGRRGADPRLVAAEDGTRDSMRGASRRLLRAVGAVPALVLSGALGFLSVHLLRHRPLRRAFFLGLSALRTANRVSQPIPESPEATADGATASPVEV